MKLIVLLSLTALVCFVQGLELERLQAKAHRCCLVGCSRAEMESIKHHLDNIVSTTTLTEEEAAIVEHATKLVAGELECPKARPSGKTRSISPRTTTGSGTLNVTCPTTLINASTKPVSVICSYSANIFNDTFYYIYGYAFSPQGGGSLSNFVYLYQTPISSYSGIMNFTVPQYAANGTWTVEIVAYDITFAHELYTLSSFQVAVGTNDITPPTLNSASVGTWSVNPCSQSNFLTLNVSDNLSGISYIFAYAYGADSYALDWAQSYSPPLKGNQIITIPANSYYNVQPGVQYSLEVELEDAALNYVYQYSGSSLLPYITPVESSCFAGYYAPVGTTTCQQCPSSTFSNNGSVSCCACPAGTISAGPGAAQCISCPYGYYSVGGSSQCTKCPAGTYNPSSGAAVCYPCPAGETSVLGSQYCTECAPGYTSCSGAASCTACAKGTYSTYGLCLKCAPGYYGPTTAASQCTACPANTYAATTGATACTACPSGKHGPAASNSVLNCA